jgi:TonB-linked SusC/RagA family outer membrane protein
LLPLTGRNGLPQLKNHLLTFYCITLQNKGMRFLFHVPVVCNRYRKMLLIMRLTAFFLLTGMMHAGANGFTQTVTLSVKNMPLEKVCREIEKQTGYYFVYAKDMTEKNLLVNLYVKDENLQNVLHTLFTGLPYSYQVIDKVVVINTVKKENYEKQQPRGVVVVDTGEVKGKVFGTGGEPLMNATVTATKSKQAVTTDVKGDFQLKGVAKNDELVISYTGYKTQKIKLDASPHYFVQMVITEDELDKVVVQAYGTTSRRLTTSNIAAVTAADIEKQPVLNPLTALQGRVAGLEVTAQSGYEYGPLKVEIRGRNVVNSNFTSDPLYIIDGIPLTILDVNGTHASAYSSNNLSYGLDQTHLLPIGGQNPLFSLNPRDIESIEVLKDADATAIYGSRGANGVILINTKKGKAGKTRFSLDISQGVNFITKKWDMLNTQQYLAMRREAFKNDGLTPTAAGGSGYAPDLFLMDTTRYTDWQKYFWGHAGNWTQVQSDYSGGTSQTLFRLGAGYNSSKDITSSSGGSHKASFSFSLNTRSQNQKFTTALSVANSYTNTNMTNISAISTLPPDAPGVYDSAGNLNYAGWKAVGLTYNFGNLLRPYSTKTNFLNGSLELKYVLAKGLFIKTLLGYNNTDNNIYNSNPIASQDPNATIPATGIYTTASTKQSNWSIEPQAQYDVVIGRGRLSALAGATLQNSDMKTLSVIASGYTNDALLGSLASAPTLSSTNASGKYKYGGVFGRLTYNWDGKYIANLNGRRDGSSRFGEGKRFGNFGSAGVAWIASEEPFVQNWLPKQVSFVKFRSSYGITGSDAVGDYQYLTQWGNTSTSLTTYNGVSPLVEQIQPNSNFHWQVNKKLEVAMDLGLLSNRITIEAAYYRNRCDNQLISFPTPVFTGFSNVVANSPANVLNTGLEFTANAGIITRKNFGWSMDFNIGFNRNKLVSYPNFDQSPYYTLYKIGQSLNNRYLYNYLGIDPLTGMYVYEDYNHDGVITANESVPKGTGTDDRYKYVNLAPDFFGGMQHSFRYKSLMLSLLFKFVKQTGNNALNNNYPGNMANTSVWQYKHRWQKPGDMAQAPALTTLSTFNAASLSSSTGNWTDASYIRLGTVAFSWMVPSKILAKAKISNLALNVNAQNLFVITPFRGGDPEGARFGGMPPVRTVTAGVSCSL